MPDRADEFKESSQQLAKTWAAVLRDMRSLAIDLTAAGAETARHMPRPSMDELAASWARIEEAVLREVKSRLDELDDQDLYLLRRRSRPAPSPARLLDDLLHASVEMDSTESREELYRALLRQLVPDEARILAALADGTPYPLVHVQARANGGRVLLANASTVGRAAGVQVLEAVSTYVGHLRMLGLAEEGPADDSLAMQYDILLAEPSVRQAEQDGEAGRLGTKVIRRTLRISPLGRQLWRACRPAEPPEAGPADEFGSAASAPTSSASPPTDSDPPDASPDATARTPAEPAPPEEKEPSDAARPDRPAPVAQPSTAGGPGGE